MDEDTLTLSEHEITLIYNVLVQAAEETSNPVRWDICTRLAGRLRNWHNEIIGKQRVIFPTHYSLTREQQPVHKAAEEA